MQLGCCIPVEHLDKVLQAGFDFAELKVETTLPEAGKATWETAKREILSHNVPIRGFNVLLPRGAQIVGPDVSYKILRPYLEVVFARMAELGGENISFGSGGARVIPDGFNREEAEEQILTFTQLLAELADAYQMIVNIEFLNRKETNTILTLTEAYRYAKLIEKNSIKILADLYHLQEENEPLSDLFDVVDKLGYVHVADTGRLYPGSGAYPYQEFFSKLHQIGYDGAVSVECRWQNLDTELKASAEFLRKMWETTKGVAQAN